MKEKERYFNSNGEDDGMIIGKPTGFVNFNDTSLKWANTLYKTMQSLSWFPSEIDCSNESKSFMELTENEQMVYKLVFANLSFLDSAQSQNVIDFRQNVTHKILQSTLTLQAAFEDLHSQSYAVILSEIGNSEEVFSMYKTEDVLMDRNERVSELFSRHPNTTDKTNLLCNAMSSILLEGVLFMTSFAYVYSLGNKMQGSSSMVSMINKDEYIHEVIFSNIFKNLVNQLKPSSKDFEKVYKMMDDAVKIEIDFARFICETYPILGVNISDLESTISNYANKKLQAIGLTARYQESPVTSMQKLVLKFGKANDTKSNFFESSVKTYAKDSINMDF